VGFVLRWGVRLFGGMVFFASARCRACCRFCLSCVAWPPRSVGLCFVFNVTQRVIRPSAIAPRALPHRTPISLTCCLTMCYHIDHLPSFAECSFAHIIALMQALPVISQLSNHDGLRAVARILVIVLSSTLSTCLTVNHYNSTIKSHCYFTPFDTQSLTIQ
jgi:hypothetical protein